MPGVRPAPSIPEVAGATSAEPSARPDELEVRLPVVHPDSKRERTGLDQDRPFVGPLSGPVTAEDAEGAARRLEGPQGGC